MAIWVWATPGSFVRRSSFPKAWICSANSHRSSVRNKDRPALDDWNFRSPDLRSFRIRDLSITVPSGSVRTEVSARYRHGRGLPALLESVAEIERAVAVPLLHASVRTSGTIAIGEMASGGGWSWASLFSTPVGISSANTLAGR